MGDPVVKKYLEMLRAAAKSEEEIRVDLGDASVFGIVNEMWISGRYDRNIRIDQPKHLRGGDPHAHVYGRKGNQIVVVNLNGTGSHGTTGKLHPKDADALRARTFEIPKNNVIEWWEVGDLGQIALFESSNDTVQSLLHHLAEFVERGN